MLNFVWLIGASGQNFSKPFKLYEARGVVDHAKNYGLVCRKCKINILKIGCNNFNCILKVND